MTKTSFILISHDKDRKFCSSSLHHRIYLKSVLTHIFRLKASTLSSPVVVSDM